MRLEAAQIEKLAARKNVRRVAVENFLGTLSTMSRADALANLAQDARDYGWNAATVAAIRSGILKAVA